MFPMSTLILPLVVAASFVCSGSANLWVYFQTKRSKPHLLYLGVWILCLVPFGVSAGLADFNDSPAVRFGALNHQVQELKQDLARKQSQGTGNPRVMKESAEEIQKIESSLAAEKMSEPILPQVPWKAVAVASLIISVVVPGGMLLVRSARHRRALTGNGLSDQPNP
jgi:hypothetical protein